MSGCETGERDSQIIIIIDNGQMANLRREPVTKADPGGFN
jgi:hypothetical protein